MREILIRNRRAVVARHVMAVVNVPAAAVLAASLVVGWAEQAHAETLRWKLNPGEVLHYTMESKEVMNTQVQGRDKKSTRSTTTNLSWTVRNVSANGDAEISLRFNRVRMRVEQPPFMPLEFDSNPVKVEIPEEFEAVERQIKALAGAEFVFTLRPTGEIDNLKVPDQTLKKLREGVTKDAPPGESLSEQSLKELLLQSSPPAFPSGSLEPGKTWTAKPSKVPIPGLGTIVVEKVSTFQGPDPKTPRLLLIDVEAKASLETADNVTAKIRKQEGAGGLTFDAQTGRIVNSRNKQKIEMIITDRGQNIIQSSDTTTTMTLEP
jgi:hypothetical protein